VWGWWRNHWWHLWFNWSTTTKYVPDQTPLTSVKLVTVSDNPSTAIIKNNWELWTWWYNWDGGNILWFGDNISRYSPEKTNLDWLAQVCLWRSHWLWLKEDWTLRAWWSEITTTPQKIEIWN
jgi:hypothetical protein